jgi:hypothetical protein
MPQLSLYIDAKTLSKLQEAAKINNTSVSKWVNKKLKEELLHNWPDNYQSLFGSINDESFTAEHINDLSFSDDAEREPL